MVQQMLEQGIIEDAPLVDGDDGATGDDADPDGDSDWCNETLKVWASNDGITFI